MNDAFWSLWTHGQCLCNANIVKNSWFPTELACKMRKWSVIYARLVIFGVIRHAGNAHKKENLYSVELHETIGFAAQNGATNVWMHGPWCDLLPCESFWPRRSVKSCSGSFTTKSHEDAQSHAADCLPRRVTKMHEVLLRIVYHEEPRRCTKPCGGLFSTKSHDDARSLAADLFTT